jgi:hypothetical protein
MSKSQAGRVRRWLLDHGYIRWVVASVYGREKMAIELSPRPPDPRQEKDDTLSQKDDILSTKGDISYTKDDTLSGIAALKDDILSPSPACKVRPRPLEGREPVDLVPQGNAILNGPLDLNEPLEGREEEERRPRDGPSLVLRLALIVKRLVPMAGRLGHRFWVRTGRDPPRPVLGVILSA